MQSSANMQLAPEESVTMSVPANHLFDFSQRGLSMVGMSGFTIRHRKERIPIPAIEERYPSLF